MTPVCLLSSSVSVWEMKRQGTAVGRQRTLFWRENARTPPVSCSRSLSRHECPAEFLPQVFLEGFDSVFGQRKLAFLAQALLKGAHQNALFPTYFSIKQWPSDSEPKMLVVRKSYPEIQSSLRLHGESWQKMVIRM